MLVRTMYPLSSTPEMYVWSSDISDSLTDSIQDDALVAHLGSEGNPTELMKIFN
jgi:hypothetical protein